MRKHDTQHHHNRHHYHRNARSPGARNGGRNPAGCRARTAPHYRAEARAAAFEGLPSGVSPHAIVDLLERAGRHCGWTSQLIAHFKLLIDYTRPQDWERGARPVVWLTVREAADRLGLSESQVRRNEAALMRLGALAFRDSGNHRRFGHRDGDGGITNAYGLDLSPAAALLAELTVLAETLARDREEWYRLKHALSASRRRVRAALHGAIHDRRIGDTAADMLFTELAGLGARVRSHTALDELRRRLGPRRPPRPFDGRRSGNGRARQPERGGRCPRTGSQPPFRPSRVRHGGRRRSRHRWRRTGRRPRQGRNTRAVRRPLFRPSRAGRPGLCRALTGERYVSEYACHGKRKCEPWQASMRATIILPYKGFPL